MEVTLPEQYHVW